MVLVMIGVLVFVGVLELVSGFESAMRIYFGAPIAYQYQHVPLGVLCLGLATLLFLLGPPPGRDGGAGGGR
jgi:hypothetical protein